MDPHRRLKLMLNWLSWSLVSSKGSSPKTLLWLRSNDTKLLASLTFERSKWKLFRDKSNLTVVLLCPKNIEASPLKLFPDKLTVLKLVFDNDFGISPALQITIKST